MISIYLLIKKINLFSQFQLYSIFKKAIYTYCIERIHYKISIWAQKLFYLLFLENNEFLQFSLQKYFDSFSFKKMIFRNYLKQHNFICKEILIKRKK